jgi:hypothetical protein
VGETWEHESGAAGPVTAASGSDVVIDINGHLLDVPAWQLREEWKPKTWGSPQ